MTAGFQSPRLTHRERCAGLCRECKTCQTRKREPFMVTFKHISAAALASIFVLAITAELADAQRGRGGGGGAAHGWWGLRRRWWWSSDGRWRLWRRWSSNGRPGFPWWCHRCSGRRFTGRSGSLSRGRSRDSHCRCTPRLCWRCCRSSMGRRSPRWILRPTLVWQPMARKGVGLPSCGGRRWPRLLCRGVWLRQRLHRLGRLPVGKRLQLRSTAYGGYGYGGYGYGGYGY